MQSGGQGVRAGVAREFEAMFAFWLVAEETADLKILVAILDPPTSAL